MPAMLYDVFTNQLMVLEQLAMTNGQASEGIPQRQWHAPFNWASGDPEDIPGITQPYSRDEINAAYPNFFQGDDKASDAMAAKLQADYVGAQEQMFRLRHSSPIRATMHAANRRNGHGLMSGGPLARVAEHVQDVIMSGSA